MLERRGNLIQIGARRVKNSIALEKLTCPSLFRPVSVLSNSVRQPCKKQLAIEASVNNPYQDYDLPDHLTEKKRGSKLKRDASIAKKDVRDVTLVDYLIAYAPNLREGLGSPQNRVAYCGYARHLQFKNAKLCLMILESCSMFLFSARGLRKLTLAPHLASH